MKRNPTFDELAEIGWMFELEFHLPPFDGYTDECFFDIHEFKETPEFQTFIGIIENVGIPYEYAKTKGSDKIFLIIKTGDLHGFQRVSNKSTYDISKH